MVSEMLPSSLHYASSGNGAWNHQQRALAKGYLHEKYLGQNTVLDMIISKRPIIKEICGSTISSQAGFTNSFNLHQSEATAPQPLMSSSEVVLSSTKRQ